MRKAAIGVLFLALGGCAITEVVAPVSGRLGDGTRSSGLARGGIDGVGSFRVGLPDRVVCTGTYNSLSLAAEFVAPVECSDGRRGTAVIHRAPDGLSGTALVNLEDGTTGRFVFGDQTFEQAFPDG